MTSAQVRHTFLEFFKNKGHKIVPSAPLPIKNDSSLMFTNAGMNQFKNIFLGVSPIKYKRVANTQKCLRVSGKHNDLEDVGFDTYHHTFFEMLGNWSFGDYFKKEAIQLAWELLVDVYRLPKNRLYATYFEGSKNLEKDIESKNIWQQYLPGSHILEGNSKDNFWEMGAIGPCGPSSEIHIDLRSEKDIKEIPGHKLINQGHEQVIELWNLVFIQYNRKADGSLESLPYKHVDTGMGFERLSMVLQGKLSSYDTDIFEPLIKFIEKQANIKYTNDGLLSSVAMRVIADHSRAITMAIADNEIPSNTAQGYVIRRMLRRASRYAYSYLNQKEPFIYKLVEIISAQFKTTFTEINEQQSFISSTIKEEERSFLKNLEAGLKRVSKHLETNNSISGKFAFELYDTFGFPVDLTQTIARENNININLEEFNNYLNQQKERSRIATNITFSDWNILLSNQKTEFVGYDTLQVEAKISKYRKIVNKGQEQIQIVLNKTPFYAESGGQIGDTGILQHYAKGTEIKILNTIKENTEIIHIIDRLPDDYKDPFIAKVDQNKRQLTSANHSATHLLGLAINKILGEKIFQKGSYVSDKYFRFDFTYPTKVSDENLLQIESIVNELIRKNLPLQDLRNIPLEEALNMGAKAVFADKYEQLVRVIKFGDSIELCGGSHVLSTGQIGLFKIISEKASASGIRRIEAVTGPYAEQYINKIINENRFAKQLLKTSDNLSARIEKLIQENKGLEKQLKKINDRHVDKLQKDLQDNLRVINNINISCIKIIEPIDLVKSATIKFSLKYKSLIVLALSSYDGKNYINITTSKDLASYDKLNPMSLINYINSNQDKAIFSMSKHNAISILNNDVSYSSLVNKLDDYVQNL